MIHSARLLRQLSRRQRVIQNGVTGLRTRNLSTLLSYRTPEPWNRHISACCFSSAKETPENTESDESFPAFSELDDLHSVSKEVLSRAGIQSMTEIQAKTWEAALSGKDVIGRARTGTGKTLAFLLPSLERVLQNPVENKVKILIISPTRELAHQIYDQANMLTRHHSRQVNSQVVYGGVSKNRDIELMERQVPTILTATPGRLMDHLDSTYIRNKPFPDYLQNIQVLVLDEMDRLLDMGFRDTIRQILSYLPQERQTLLFSATVPPEVRSMIDMCVVPDHELIDCIQEEDPTTHTNEAVDQSYVVLSDNHMVWGFVRALLHYMREPDHKILVFFPTTAQVTYFANLFNRGLGRHVLEIHSKLTQNKRTNTSDRFRQARQAVMFTSDVSARGVDYPNVSHVIQFGSASDRETYIHRLGRTGRAGKKGEGVLVLTKHEKSFLKLDLAGLDVQPNGFMQGLLQESPSAQLEEDMMRITQEIRTGEAPELEGDAKAAYRSLLGFYHTRFRSLGVRSTDALIKTVNGFAAQAGLQELPPISEKLALQLGVKNHPSLNIRSRWSPGGNFDVGRRRNRGMARGRDLGFAKPRAGSFGWGPPTT